MEFVNNHEIYTRPFARSIITKCVLRRFIIVNRTPAFYSSFEHKICLGRSFKIRLSAPVDRNIVYVHNNNNNNNIT